VGVRKRHWNKRAPGGGRRTETIKRRVTKGKGVGISKRKAKPMSRTDTATPGEEEDAEGGLQHAPRQIRIKDENVRM